MLAAALHEPRPGIVPIDTAPARSQHCRDCPARNKAVCGAASAEALDRLACVAALQQLAAGDNLLDEGDEATHCFTITAGSVKLYKLLPDGRRQITGFLSQGDFLGLAFDGHYTYSADALTDTTVCRVRRGQFEGLLETYPAMERRLLAMVSHELAAAQDQMVVLGRKTAQERVASFLLSLVRRQQRRGHDGKAIRLTMTRTDIGDYLGLTTETVSRTLTALRVARSIKLDGVNLIRILDPARLEALADTVA